MPMNPRVLRLLILIPLVTAWFCLLGWSFAEHFYHAFEIDFADLHLPLEYLLMWAALALEFASGWLVLVALGWWWLFVALDHPVGEILRGLLRLPPWAFHGLLALLFLVSGYFLGEWSARGIHGRELASGFPSLPRVRVVMKPGGAWEHDRGLQSLAQELKRGCYQLLVRAHNPLRLVLFRHEQGKPLLVELIPETEVATVRHLPYSMSCPP